MSVALGAAVINAVHVAQQNHEQIVDTTLADKLEEIAAADRILKRMKRSVNIEKSLAQEDCTEEDKQLIRELLENEHQNRPDLFDYRLNVILSNDAVFKSLTPKLEIRINDVEVEMSADGLSDLRYEVARAIHRMQHYQH
ncbi:hypothetical protein M3Y98_00059600 [Aphelenchoides besseyi]|nr:hypothetical protein M3Y98_00059600 [Aphelenchoides besseyi]